MSQAQKVSTDEDLINSTTTVDLNTKQNNQEYTEQPYRWINLGLFLFAALSNSIPNQTFTAINTRVVQLYHVHKIFVAMNTLMFPITHPLLAFLANGILDKFGLKIGCSAGAIFMIAGCWIRTLINESIWFTVLGSLVASVGNIFIINSPSKIASIWFSPDNVPIITTIGVLSNLLSGALGLILPALFVKVDSPKADVVYLLVIEAIIVSAPMLLLLIFLKNKPNKPPSFAAAVKNDKKYLDDLKKLFLDKNYLLLLIIMSMSYGTLLTVLTDIQYLILPFRYFNPIKLSSNLLIIASIAGGFGCFLFISLLKKTHKFKVILLIAILGALLFTFILPFSLNTFEQWILYINLGIVGFFIIPVTPIIMQFGCQIAFPIGQASSSGFLLAGGQLLGFAAGAGFLSFLDGVSVWKVYFVCSCFTVFYLIAIITLYFIKQDLKRRRYELRKRRLSQDITNDQSTTQK